MYKVLIVDDEMYARSGVKLLVEKNYGRIAQVYEASDGIEALELSLRIKPDIIVTDIRMPHMDGLEFCAQIKDVLPDTRLVILSGYTDFTYARKAIWLNVEDYLTKPIFPQELNTIFGRLFQELDQEKEARYAQNGSPDQIAVMTDLITGDLSGKSLLMNEYLCYQLPISLNVQGIAVIGGETIRYFDNFEYYTMNQKKLLKEAETAFTELFGKNALVFPHGSQIIVSFCSGETAGICLSKVHDGISRLFALADSIQITLNAGISIGSGIDVRNCYQQAHEALLNSYFLGRQNAVPYTDTNDWRKNYQTMKESIIRSLKPFRPEELTDIARRYFTSCEGMTQDYYICKQFLHVFLCELEQSDLYILDPTIFAQIPALFPPNGSRDRYLKHLSGLFQAVSQNLWDTQAKDRNTFIRKIEQYIQEHYSEKLTLSTLSERFALSPNYLCSLFKTKTGLTFIDYLNTVRIENAAALLSTTDHLTYEIAAMVGYSDYRYFSQIFKKLMSITPTEYRKQNTKICK